MRRLLPFLAVVLLLVVYGCSGGGGGNMLPVTPEQIDRPASAYAHAPHVTWGLFQFAVDPAAQMLEVVPLRAGNMHLNVLCFLEPPPMAFLTVENIEFNTNIVEVDVGIRHPFLGLTEFTGFDVCGILISNGTITGFNDSDIVMAGNPEDTYLMNPDGYTPWWNPVNFPYNEQSVIFGYIDGLLGAPDDYGHYNSTVCGYKYYADDLGPTDDLDTLILANRGMFSAGQKNLRHFTVHIGENWLIFNYAIDASWMFPEGDPPWEAPESFSISANKLEAFHISVTETDNTLYYVDDTTKGGILGLDVIVYDWQGSATIETVGFESMDGSFPYIYETVPTETSEYSGTYHLEFSGDNLVSSAPLDFFITITDIADDPILGDLRTYFMSYGYPVGTEDPITWEDIIFYCADYGIGRNIFSIDIEGLTEPYQWTEQTSTAEWCEGPEVSPDGLYVLYLRYSWSGFVSELRRLTIETEEDISLTGGMTNWYTYGDWRHDGQKIVYSYSDSIFAGDGEMYTMDIDGSNKELLTTTGLYTWAPKYSPDDSKIVFQSFNNNQVYIYDIAGDSLTQYTNNGTWNDDPTYSPDGQHIAWATAYNGGGRRIYVSPVAAWDPPWKVIGYEQYIRSPGFSTDGTKIVYDHGGYSGAEIAIFDLTDDTYMDITSNAWGDYQADWGQVPVYD